MSLICQCFAFSNATMHARSEGRSMPLVESEGEYKTERNGNGACFFNAYCI